MDVSGEYAAFGSDHRKGGNRVVTQPFLSDIWMAEDELSSTRRPCAMSAKYVAAERAVALCEYGGWTGASNQLPFLQ